MASRDDKLRQWASVVAADAVPLSVTWAILESSTPEVIADKILVGAASLPNFRAVEHTRVPCVLAAKLGPDLCDRHRLKALVRGYAMLFAWFRRKCADLRMGQGRVVSRYTVGATWP